MGEAQISPPKKNLEIMTCTQSQDILLVLQYLLPPRLWKYNSIFSLSLVSINLEQLIMRINIYIWTPFMNW